MDSDREPAVCRHPHRPEAQYRDGKLKINKLVTNTYDLKEVNQGYHDMLEGKNLRGMLVY